MREYAGRARPCAVDHDGRSARVTLDLSGRHDSIANSTRARYETEMFPPGLDDYVRDASRSLSVGDEMAIGKFTYRLAIPMEIAGHIPQVRCVRIPLRCATRPVGHGHAWRAG